MQIRTHQPFVATPLRGPKPQHQVAQESSKTPGDQVEISQRGPVATVLLKGLKATAGAVGAVVGGTLGLVPGLALGLNRSLFGPDESGDHLAVCHVGDTWGLSYGMLGAGVALLACSVLQTNPIQNVAMLAAAVPAAMAPQAIFRGLVRTSTRSDKADSCFTSTLDYCADRAMHNETQGLLSGVKAGIRHGARQGKLAFQDLLVPALRPARNHYYGAGQQ